MKNLFLIIFVCLMMFPLINLGNETRFKQYDIDTFRYWRAREAKAEKLRLMLLSDKSLNGWSKYYAYKGFLSLKKINHDSAAYYSLLAIDFYESEDKGTKVGETSMAKAYYMIGLKEYFDDKKMKSIETLYKALDFSKLHYEKGTESWETSIISRISIIHQEMGDFKLALNYKLKLLSYKEYMKHQYAAGNALNNIGSLYLHLNKLDSAKYYFRKAIFTYNDTSIFSTTTFSIKNDANTAACFNYIGYIHYLRNQLDSSNYYFKKSYSYYDEHDLKNNYTKESIYFHVEAGRAFSLMYAGKNKDALDILKETKIGVDTLMEFNRTNFLVRKITYQYLARAYYAVGDYEKSLEIKDEYISFIEQAEAENLSDRLQQYTTFYQLKEKENSISTLISENETQKTILEQRNIINIILLFLILLTITTAGIVIRQRRLKSKYLYANLEQRLLRSQLNPHFIFNALSSISGLAESKSDRTVPYVLKFSSLLRLILKNSREEFVTLEDEIQAINDYLELQSNFSKSFTFDVKLKDGNDTQEVLIPPMFIQPFIENSIKHGLHGINDGKISVEIGLDENEKLLECLITDNGIGYKKGLEIKAKTTSHESLSGKILEERLKVYARSFNKNVSYKIQDLAKSSRGTQIHLLLPYLIDN